LREVIMKLKVLFPPESMGGYSVSVPALPGCHSQGESLEEALEDIREAAELWLEVGTETASTLAARVETGTELQDIDL
jgi:predicted RNase H-like HicB family nuclease